MFSHFCTIAIILLRFDLVKHVLKELVYLFAMTSIIRTEVMNTLTEIIYGLEEFLIRMNITSYLVSITKYAIRKWSY